ncbi:hypothetical protein BGZ96_005270, partial [Linnemannia gamsii]
MKKFITVFTIAIASAYASICDLPESLVEHCTCTDIGVTCSDSPVTEIPDYAFSQSVASKVQNIDLSGNKISKVGSRAFYSENPSKNPLIINLENNLLTSASFQPDSFAGNGMAIMLKLGGNPNILVLDESVFKPFLLNGRIDSGQQNIVDMRGSPLSCSRPNLWILEN